MTTILWGAVSSAVTPLVALGHDRTAAARAAAATDTRTHEAEVKGRRKRAKSRGGSALFTKVTTWLSIRPTLKSTN